MTLVLLTHYELLDDFILVFIFIFTSVSIFTFMSTFIFTFIFLFTSILFSVFIFLFQSLFELLYAFFVPFLFMITSFKSIHIRIFILIFSLQLIISPSFFSQSIFEHIFCVPLKKFSFSFILNFLHIKFVKRSIQILMIVQFPSVLFSFLSIIDEMNRDSLCQSFEDDCYILVIKSFVPKLFL